MRYSSSFGPVFLHGLCRILPPVFAVGLLPVVLGWGGGHDPLNEWAVSVFPEPVLAAVPETARAGIVRFSHAPDDFTPWEKQTRITIHPDDLAWLEAHGLKHPYSLHSPRGQAANFILLVRAFRAESPDRIAYWSACLLHTFADEAACNHDPILHVVTYAFREGYKLDMGPAGVLDFAQVSNSAEDREAIRAMLADYAPAPLAEDPQEALVQVMLLGLAANEYMTQRGARIARTFARSASAAAVADGRRALAELGVHAIRTGVDAIATARLLADRGTIPELTPAVEREFERRSQVFLARRPLASDAVFEGLLEPFGDGPAVGVLVEPSRSMDKAYLGFGSKLLSAAIMRSLRGAGISCRLVDIREPEFPAPERMPVAVVCAGGFHHPPTVERLRRYAGQGGRILLIGGEHRGVLGELSECLGKPADARLPVTPKYGQNNADYIADLRVHFTGGLEDSLGSEPCAFLRNPDTKAGWQKPRCDYVLTGENPHVQVLARLRDGERELDIAGLLTNPQGQTIGAFLPEYLLAPYLLTDSPPLDDPSRLELDRVGCTVLLHALGRMLPRP